MEVEYDIAFVVDTRQYSGNFEREMTAYVTGGFPEYHGETEAALFNSQVQDQAIIDELTDKKCDAHHNEYDDAPCAICPTPGRTNNGAGVQSDITPDNPRVYEAYESVAMFFSEIPSDKLIAFMKDRANCFGEINNLTIVGFRLLKQTTVVTETELAL